MSKSRPTVGIDASRLTVGQRTGTENYSLQITRHLVDLDASAAFDWRGYLNGRVSDLALEDRERPVNWRPIPFPRFWTHGRLSLEMLLHRPDLLFVPAHVVPVWHPRSVVTIHDLGFLRYPESHTPDRVRALDRASRWNARVARRIIVPSVATRDDLIAHYAVPAERITVVHHGVDDRFRHGETRGIRGRYGLARPYVLAVGTIQPRKNLAWLARAVTAVAAAGIDCDLAIAGKPGWMADDVLRELEATGIGGRLRMLSYIADEDLPGLYHDAACFVLPSRFEGFGLPAVEAMASGTPTIVAGASSLPEIVGTGGVIVPLDDDARLASEIRRVLVDENWAAELRARAMRRADDFSWERAACETLAVLAAALPG